MLHEQQCYGCKTRLWVSRACASMTAHGDDAFSTVPQSVALRAADHEYGTTT
jgi:hypothetical protein